LLGFFVPADDDSALAASPAEAAELMQRLEQEKNQHCSTWPEIRERLNIVDRERERRRQANTPDLTSEEALCFYQSLREAALAAKGREGAHED
jgi:hypothetical protein